MTTWTSLPRSCGPISGNNAESAGNGCAERQTPNAKPDERELVLTKLLRFQPLAELLVNSVADLDESQLDRVEILVQTDLKDIGYRHVR
jgi:hypothetical protein